MFLSSDFGFFVRCLFCFFFSVVFSSFWALCLNAGLFSVSPERSEIDTSEQISKIEESAGGEMKGFESDPHTPRTEE